MPIYRGGYGGFSGSRYSLPRSFQIVFLIATIVLVCKYDDGTCLKWSTSKSKAGTTNCEIRINSTMGIMHWSDTNGYAQLNGQYFVVGSSFIFCIVSVVLCFSTMMRRSQPQSVVVVQTPVYSLQPRLVQGRQGGMWYPNQQEVYGGQPYSVQQTPMQGTPPQSGTVKFLLLLGAIVLLAAGGLEAWLASGFGRIQNVIVLYAIAAGTCVAASLLYMIDYMMGMAVEKASLEV